MTHSLELLRLFIDRPSCIVNGPPLILQGSLLHVFFSAFHFPCHIGPVGAREVDWQNEWIRTTADVISTHKRNACIMHISPVTFTHMSMPADRLNRPVAMVLIARELEVHYEVLLSVVSVATNEPRNEEYECHRRRHGPPPIRRTERTDPSYFVCPPPVPVRHTQF